ncbi:hypothetical protein Tco_0619905 [Tanacetum coccineum]
MGTKEFVPKLVRGRITTPQGITKTPDRRLLELEDQINFLLKRSRPAPPSSSTHNPQAYVNAAYSSSHPKNQNESPILNSFAFRERTGPAPQPQALGTTFEARVRDLHGLRTPKDVKDLRKPSSKQCEKITRNEEKDNNKTNETPDNTKMPTEMKMSVKKAEAMNRAENGAENKSIKTPENNEAVEAFGSQPVAYYLRHKINKKMIKGLVKNNRFNNSLSETRVGKKKGKANKVIT